MPSETTRACIECGHATEADTCSCGGDTELPGWRSERSDVASPASPEGEPDDPREGPPRRAWFRRLPSGSLVLDVRPSSTVAGDYAEYVRADLYDAVRAQLSQVEGERDRWRAESDVARGVGCEEPREGEPTPGPCGVCLKCLRRALTASRQHTESLRQAVEGLPSFLDAGPVVWNPGDYVSRPAVLSLLDGGKA